MPNSVLVVIKSKFALRYVLDLDLKAFKRNSIASSSKPCSFLLSLNYSNYFDGPAEAPLPS